MARKRVAAGTFGAWLIGAQSEAGVSNAALAASVGVDPATVSLWRTNRFPPDEGRLPAIARALGVPPAQVRAARFGAADPLAGMQLDAERRLAQLQADAQRALVPELALPVDLELAALDFEREAVASRADPAFVRFARTMLRAPALVRLLAADSSSARGQQYQALVSALRVMLALRASAAGGATVTLPGVTVEVSQGRDVTEEAERLRRRGAGRGAGRGKGGGRKLA